MRGLSDKRLIRSRFGAAFVNPWRESREFPLDLWCIVREGNYPSFRCRKQAMNSRTVFAVVTVVLFGLGLRLLFGSTSALTSDIAAFYSADSISMALLTTGPVIVLGVCAAAAGVLLSRARVTHVLVGCLILIAVAPRCAQCRPGRCWWREPSWRLRVLRWRMCWVRFWYV